MKIIKTLLAVLVALILVFSVWNKISLHRCVKMLNQKNTAYNDLEKAKNVTERAVINSQEYANKFIGSTLILKDLEKIYPVSTSSQENLINKDNRPMVLLTFSEMGCNACLDDQTNFVNELYQVYGPGSVACIVYADNKRYVRNYIRINQVKFPVFFDKDGTFFEENQITDTPLLLIIDGSRKILYSHFPIPGHLQFSEPFHHFCYRYFNLN